MRWLLFAILLIVNVRVHAQSVDDAYKREKAYLLAQKSSLIQMKTSLKLSFAARKTSADRSILIKQSEFSKEQLKNQELLEEYKAIEKISKESSQMAGQLEKQNLKINEILASTNSKLGLIFDESIEKDVNKKFESNLQSAQQLITVMSAERWRKHAFLDEKEHLVTGEVLFNGLFSAWGKVDSKIVSLAPYNKDFLKIVPATDGKGIYIFAPDFQKVNIISAKTWKESVADTIPGIVMGMILIAVFGLFIMLARS